MELAHRPASELVASGEVSAAEVVASSDAAVVTRLRAAGALVPRMAVAVAALEAALGGYAVPA